MKCHFQSFIGVSRDFSVELEFVANDQMIVLSRSSALGSSIDTRVSGLSDWYFLCELIEGCIRDFITKIHRSGHQKVASWLELRLRKLHEEDEGYDSGAMRLSMLITLIHELDSSEIESNPVF